MGVPSIDLDGIQYYCTVPIGLSVGLATSVAIVLLAGPSWWIVLPPVAGIWLGKKVGDWISR